ncbi:MAG: hypothetical protein ACM3S0_05140 [Acidobacteriota bacterium]
MTRQTNEKHYSPRTTNILLGASVIILIASVLIRYLITSAPQEGVLVLMGIGVFLFLLVAFDQPS